MKCLKLRTSLAAAAAAQCLFLSPFIAISFSVSDAFANSGGGSTPSVGDSVDDPLAFLEGPVHCAQIIKNVESRYGASGPQKLSPMLKEEYRHVAEETCDNPRYGTCTFSWCGNTKRAIASAQKPAVDKSDRELAKLDDEESQILEALNETGAKLAGNGSKAPAADQQTARARLSNPETATTVKVEKAAAAVLDQQTSETLGAELEKAAKTAPQAPQPAKLAGERPELVPALVSPPPAVASAIPETPAPELSVDHLANERLATLIRSNQELRRRAIDSQLEREHARGIEWQMVAVPGSDHRPRVRSVDPSTSNPMQSSSPSDNPFNRTITPGIDPTYPRNVPLTGNTMPQGVAPMTGRVGTPVVSDQPLIGVNNVPVPSRNGYRKILQQAQERQEKYERY
ncbi:MAG: hypothetical protein U0136_05145 [Bdellovibrionota bacterium]